MNKPEYTKNHEKNEDYSQETHWPAENDKLWN